MDLFARDQVPISISQNLSSILSWHDWLCPKGGLMWVSPQYPLANIVFTLGMYGKVDETWKYRVDLGCEWDFSRSLSFIYGMTVRVCKLFLLLTTVTFCPLHEYAVCPSLLHPFHKDQPSIH